VEVWDSGCGDHFLLIHGRFVNSNEEFHLLNIYAPCDQIAKKVSRDSLTAHLQLLGGKMVCVCGDFNAVRDGDEHRYVRGGYLSSDSAPFNNFIDDNILVNLPLHNRKYTWFKGDGKSMSRLDRFLLSKE
jgi:hypothetical protein